MNLSHYSKDLSYIHDEGFGGFSEKAGEHILSLLKKEKIFRRHVTDLGCGSGIWAEQLVKNGYDVTGIDLSPEMIRIARRRVPSATFVTGSFLDVPIQRSVLITSLGECFNYLFDKRMNSSDALNKLFRRCYDALEPGGVLIFDMLVWKEKTYSPYKTFVQGKDWSVLVEVNIDRRRRMLTRAITSFRRKGPAFRKTEETHGVCLHHEKGIVAQLRQSGFLVSSYTAYGRMKLRPGHVVFVASKQMERYIRSHKVKEY